MSRGAWWTRVQGVTEASDMIERHRDKSNSTQLKGGLIPKFTYIFGSPCTKLCFIIYCLKTILLTETLTHTSEFLKINPDFFPGAG